MRIGHGESQNLSSHLNTCKFVEDLDLGLGLDILNRAGDVVRLEGLKVANVGPLFILPRIIGEKSSLVVDNGGRRGGRGGGGRGRGRGGR